MQRALTDALVDSTTNVSSAGTLQRQMSLTDSDPHSDDNIDILARQMPRCINMPTPGPGGLTFAGAKYIPYVAGSCGWVSEIFDTHLWNSIVNMKIDKHVSVWVNVDALCPPLRCKLPPLWRAEFVYHCPAPGDVEATLGHPGCFFHFVLQTSPVIMATSFALVEHARRTQRIAVWT